MFFIKISTRNTFSVLVIAMKALYSVFTYNTINRQKTKYETLSRPAFEIAIRYSGRNNLREGEKRAISLAIPVSIGPENCVKVTQIH